jgi:cation-transporting ATPase 13A2
VVDVLDVSAHDAQYSVLLLAPPEMAMKVLELMWMPLGGRYTLLLAAAINVGLSLAFEEWGTQGVSFVIGWMMEWLQQRRWRTGQKAAYKLVEGECGSGI